MDASFRWHSKAAASPGIPMTLSYQQKLVSRKFQYRQSLHRPADFSNKSCNSSQEALFCDEAIRTNILIVYNTTSIDTFENGYCIFSQMYFHPDCYML